MFGLLSTWDTWTDSRLQAGLCKVFPAVQTLYGAAWKVQCELHDQWHSI